jgi:hypothetical protein
MIQWKFSSQRGSIANEYTTEGGIAAPESTHYVEK